MPSSALYALSVCLCARQEDPPWPCFASPHSPFPRKLEKKAGLPGRRSGVALRNTNSDALTRPGGQAHPPRSGGTGRQADGQAGVEDEECVQEDGHIHEGHDDGDMGSQHTQDKAAAKRRALTASSSFHWQPLLYPPSWPWRLSSPC